MPSQLHRFRVTVLAILLSVCAAWSTRADDAPANDGAKDAASDKEYEVKIARKIDVGTKYALTADGALIRQVSLTVGGQTSNQPDDGYGIHLEGTVEVLELDAIGEEAKVSCTVDKCTRITSKGQKELVPKGKVIIAEGKGKDTHFSLKDGGELSKEASEALDLAISLDTGDEYTDDEMFGTKQKQKVGSSWAVDGEKVAKDARRVGVIVKPEDVEGSFRLDGLEKAGDVECLKVSGSLKMKRLDRKDDEDDGLPEGFSVETGSMEAKYGGLFPVDPSVGSLSESASMTFVTKVKGKGGTNKKQDVTVESKVQRAAEMRRRFLK